MFCKKKKNEFIVYIVLLKYIHVVRIKRVYLQMKLNIYNIIYN